MPVLSVKHPHVQIHARLGGQRFQKFTPQILLLTRDDGWKHIFFIDQIRTSGKVKADLGQGLVHGHLGTPDPCNALALAKSHGNRIAEAQTNVLQRVVGIDVHVALAGDIKVKARPMPHQIKHVVGKAEPGPHVANALAVKIHSNGNPSLAGLPVYPASSSLHDISFDEKAGPDGPAW